MKTHSFSNYVKNDSELFTVLKRLPKPEAEGPWIAGGSVWKAIEGIPLDCDIDFFFSSPQQFEVYLGMMRGVPYSTKILKESSNGYNTTFDFHIYERGKINKIQKIQFVCAVFCETPLKLIDSFDFTVCQFAFDGKTLYTGNDSFVHLKERKIVFHNIRDIYATTAHLKKYVDRGFNIPSEESEKFEKLKKSPKPKTKANRSIYPIGTVQIAADVYDGIIAADPTTPTPAPIPSFTITSTPITPVVNTYGQPMSLPNAATFYPDYRCPPPEEATRPVSPVAYHQEINHITPAPSSEQILERDLSAEVDQHIQQEVQQEIEADLRETIDSLPIRSINLIYDNVFERLEFPETPSQPAPTSPTTPSPSREEIDFAERLVDNIDPDTGGISR